MSKLTKRLKRRGVKNPGPTEVLVEALREKKVTRARVPHDFPVYTADRMRRAGVGVKSVMAPFWPARVKKTEEEVEAIREAARLTGEAIELGIDLIRRSKPRSGKLRLDGEPVTSERVRRVIEDALRDREMEPHDTIVAGGEHAVDPHDVGSGPLPSGYPVILDVFPRSLKTGYHADITRTVYRGRPSQRLLAMWDAVKEAQALGVERARAGANGREIHEAIRKILEDAGFETGPVNGKMQGFYHGTGHGLGLSVHEPPRVGAVDQTLMEGMVVTIEPGLYYPGVGGIRIEDDVVVRKDGGENLVEIEKVFVV
jgi:Xaa-Pro aminopeptidase